MELREKVVGLTRDVRAPLPFQPTEHGELYRGYSDGLARGLEFALAPAILAAMGYGLDRLLGIVPVLTIVFFLVAVSGMFARTWCAYEARMREEDAAAPWAAPRAGR